MPRIIYLFLIILCTLTSCQDYEFEQQPSFPEGSVGFRSKILQTRGTPIMGFSELQEYKVIAYQHTGLWRDVDVTTPAALFMDHISVSQVASGSWSYSPLRYWPQNENLTFFAYSPEAGKEGIPNQYGLTITTPVDGKAPVITYTVPTQVENQPDLLVSTNQNYDLNRQSNGSGGVNMDLNHALTCIGLKATGEGERIIEAKITGIVGKGSLTLGSPTINWNIESETANYEFSAGVNKEPLDHNISSILNGDGYLMMIPQVLTDEAKLILTIDGGDQPYEQTFNLNVADKGVWEAGQFIEYSFAITPSGSIILNPESLVLPALEKSYSSFSVICPEQLPDATWTVTVPQGGWLELCDNPSGVNTIVQTDKYTYSGQGSMLLYAFAPNANTLLQELSSEITLTGSSQKIGVTQLYPDEIYIPKYPHGGWAGSNVYWVEDSNYPDGGYLTFDDKDVTTHEQYQGVYFMWGSLVALSPMGTSWKGGLWINDKTNGQVLYVPNLSSASNGGWNPAVSTGWGTIPRLGWSNSSNPNNGGYPVSIPFNEDQSYLIQNHNPQKNVGDICKYITDMGWAPGAKEGRKWRMPTHLEYENVSTDYEKINSTSFRYIASDDKFGHTLYDTGFLRRLGIGTPFFPTSGYRTTIGGQNGGVDNEPKYRPGEAFTYWTSSPNGVNGDAFDYILIKGSPTNTQNFQRNTGATVRCVLENNK